MEKSGIIEGAIKTVGVVPAGLVHGLAPKGGVVDDFMQTNKEKIRLALGAGILAGVGYAAIS